MQERIVERYLRKRVEEMGGDCLKVVFPGRIGAPDRLVIMNSRLLWVELKAPRGRISEAQSRMQARLRREGQCVVVLRSREEVDKWLNRLL